MLVQNFHTNYLLCLPNNRLLLKSFLLIIGVLITSCVKPKPTQPTSSPTVMPSVPIEIAPPNGSMLIKPLGQMTAINSVGELGMVKKEDLIGDFIGEGLEATLNADGNVKMFPMFGCGNSCSYKGTWKYDGRILKIETICYSTSWWRGTSKEFIHLRTLKQDDTLYSTK